jgi:hypothetical protein
MSNQRHREFARWALVLLALLAAATLAGARPVAAAEGDTLVIDLEELNNSGVSGTATLTDNGDGTTTVSIEVTGATGGHPAHIHNGTCDDLDPNPLYPLTTVDENGTSETDVPYTLEDLLATPTAINLHESDTNLGTYIACGNITGEPLSAGAEGTGAQEEGVGGGTTPPSTGVGVLAGTGGGLALWQALAALAGMAMAGGALLRRR